MASERKAITDCPRTRGDGPRRTRNASSTSGQGLPSRDARTADGRRVSGHPRGECPDAPDSAPTRWTGQAAGLVRLALVRPWPLAMSATRCALTSRRGGQVFLGGRAVEEGADGELPLLAEPGLQVGHALSARPRVSRPLDSGLALQVGEVGERGASPDQRRTRQTQRGLRRSVGVRPGIHYDPLQFPLDVVTVLIRRFCMGADRRLHTGRCLHHQPLLLLVGPGRAFQLNQFVTQFDCRGLASYRENPIACLRHTRGVAVITQAHEARCCLQSAGIGRDLQSAAMSARGAAICRMLIVQPSQLEGEMTLRFIGTTSEHGNCPTLYEVVETGDILVQGERETNPEHLAQLRDVKDSETFVVIPRELLTRFAPKE